MNWPNPLAEYMAERHVIDPAIVRVCESGQYILGPEVERLEVEFADFHGTAEAVGVASGTDALSLSLLALGVVPGDVVATVSHTAVATAAAIKAIGANIVFVDIDASTMTMSAESLSRCLALNDRVRAVVVVHLYGQAADMPSLLRITSPRGVKVVEDCSQAHGTTLGGQFVGTFGDAGAFSCYPTKNLGALGDAGLVAGGMELCSRVRELRQYGWRQRYVSSEVGRNSRLDPLQAAVLRTRLPLLPSKLAARRRIAARYTQGLSDALVKPPTGEGHSFHQYTCLAEKRSQLADAFDQDGIPYAILYPQAVHQQPAYLACEADPLGLDVTERVYRQLICLPMHPLLTDQQIERVIATANQAMQ